MSTNNIFFQGEIRNICVTYPELYFFFLLWALLPLDCGFASYPFISITLVQFEQSHHSAVNI